MAANKLQNQKGIAVIIVVLLMGFLLSMVFALTALFIPKIKSSGEIKRSVGAIYAADSAIEYCLYIARRGPISQPSMINGASFNIEPPTCVPPIKATGTYIGVTRAFQVDFR